MANPEDIGYSSRAQWSCAECPAFGDCVDATELKSCLMDWVMDEDYRTGEYSW